mmetsp:Transcript_18657/g.30154  ORF Transcript_18657/g.30154 Transcript_18657/m.30154 type:complete len:116 (-) Transcript_18657:584-931(-)
MKTLIGLTLLIGRSSAFTSSRSRLVSPISSNSISRRFQNNFSTTLNMAAKRVLVPIADDSEEIETTCITDTLTRFGAEVVVASVKADGELVCKMSRGVKVSSAQSTNSFHAILTS